MIPDFLEPYIQEKALNKLEIFTLEIYKTLLYMHKPTTPSRQSILQEKAIEEAANLLYKLKQFQDDDTEANINPLDMN